MHTCGVSRTHNLAPQQFTHCF